jgi:hypothetical protein
MQFSVEWIRLWRLKYLDGSKSATCFPRSVSRTFTSTPFCKYPPLLRKVLLSTVVIVVLEILIHTRDSLRDTTLANDLMSDLRLAASTKKGVQYPVLI